MPFGLGYTRLYPSLNTRFLKGFSRRVFLNKGGYMERVVCEACHNTFMAKRKDAKYCGSGCRKKANRVTDNTSKGVTDKVYSVFGRERDSDEVMNIGRKSFKVKDLPYWMLDGERGSKEIGAYEVCLDGVYPLYEPQEKREKFRDLMLQHDVRYGVRGTDRELVAKA